MAAMATLLSKPKPVLLQDELGPNRETW